MTSTPEIPTTLVRLRHPSRRRGSVAKAAANLVFMIVIGTLWSAMSKRSPTGNAAGKLNFRATSDIGKRIYK